MAKFTIMTQENLEQYHGLNKGYIDTAIQTVDGKVTTNTSDITTMKSQIAALESGTYDDTEVRGLITANAEAIEAHKETIDDVVTTLVGSDANKSVRTIANEELAAQLLPESAKESLDTLEEIASWIQSHPDDASAMNLAIEALETLVGEIPEGTTATTIVAYIQEVVASEKSRAESAETALGDRLTAVEGLVGEGFEAISTEVIAGLFA